MPRALLYYVADPMCSWCWGFHPVLEAVAGALPSDVPIRYVMGGLARDTDEPMPEEMRAHIQEQWRRVAERTGATFNWGFWTRCAPRRATYPACRAVLAAAAQQPGAGPAMFHAIQRAYYVEARNPSDPATLIALAGAQGLDADRFSKDLVSPEIDRRLHEDFALRRSLHADKFPTLILEHNEDQVWLAYGYEDRDVVMDLLQSALLA
jgi:putative protein-disulfide isomerase